MSDHRDTDRDRLSKPRVSRRNFLRASAVSAGGAALAATPLIAAAQDATPVAIQIGPLVSTTLPSTWDQETDIVVGVYQNSAGEVVGVQVDNNGTTLSFRARKAVIFGTGGFTQDATKSLNYLRGPIFAGCGVPTCTGDFVDIGLALGAKFGNMNQAWWLQCPLELALLSPSITGADVWMPWATAWSSSTNTATA